MPDHRGMPDERRTRNSMLTRLDLLERRLAKFFLHWEEEVDFSLPGLIYPTNSGRHYLRKSGRLVEVVLSCDTPGSTATVIEVRRNGVVVDDGTITLPADREDIQVPLRTLYNGGKTDWATVVVTTAGTGARDLNAQLRWG